MLFGSLTYCSILLIYCTAVGVCDKVYVVSAKNPGNGLVRGKTMHVLSAQYLLQDRRKFKGTKGLYSEIKNTEIDILCRWKLGEVEAVSLKNYSALNSRGREI